MFFYFQYDFNTPLAINSNLMKSRTITGIRNGVLYLWKGRQRLETYYTQKGTFCLLGDPILPSDELEEEALFSKQGSLREAYLYETIKGHYYWFLLREREIFLGASFGAILPLYYSVKPSGVRISSSSMELAKQGKAEQLDRQNLLERLLFNYPFFNSTWWKEVKLLEAHRYLLLSDESFVVSGQFDLRNYFGEPVYRSGKHLQQLVSLFDEEVKAFFPDEDFAISFTGGFDGRTLVAAARKAKRRVLTYSFGKVDALDIVIPYRQSQKLGVPYLPINLGKTYVDREALESALAFMRLTEYNGNLGRPHYHYAARFLSERISFILTGNFGSELFRALHQPGVMMTPALINIFSVENSSWKDNLRQTVQSWDSNYFDQTLDALIVDLENYLRQLEGLKPNQKFYYFVFNELFRKYFGPEIIMQSHYLANRTPYLNLSFFKALNQTIWSGLHADLFEKNRYKRMNGQKFYARYIQNADPELYALPTAKGYAPADVLAFSRWPVLLFRLFLRRYNRKPEWDNHSVEAYFQKYFGKLSKQIEKEVLPGFLRRHLQTSFNQIPKAKNLEHWIKWYSIALGWSSAHFPKNAIIPGPGKSLPFNN